MPERSTRNRHTQKKESQPGKLYIQVIISIILICGFLMLKDVSLPNGKTPRDYAEKILTTTVNINNLLDSITGEEAVPTGTEIAKP